MDNLPQDLGHFFNEGTHYPTPLPPARNIELIRSSENMPGPCCACKRRLGTLTCGGCNAVKYCSKECQKYGSPWAGRHGWEDHKDICYKIKKHRKETEDFGGIDALLETPLVKERRCKYHCVVGEHFLGDLRVNNQQEEYVLSRLKLTEAYAKCGKEALSCAAFRLAADNMLDLFCLCSNKIDVEDAVGDLLYDLDLDDIVEDVEDDKYICCGWMVAARMDQEALNYLCYFQHRLQSSIPFPYLDLSKDEDIEGDSYLKLLKDRKGPFDLSTQEWFHDYMLVALIKYKRLQSLLVQRQKDMAGWKMFLIETHPRAGVASAIQKLRGNYLAIKKIQFYVLEEEIDF